MYPIKYTIDKMTLEMILFMVSLIQVADAVLVAPTDVSAELDGADGINVKFIIPAQPADYTYQIIILENDLVTVLISSTVSATITAATPTDTTSSPQLVTGLSMLKCQAVVAQVVVHDTTNTDPDVSTDSDLVPIFSTDVGSGTLDTSVDPPQLVVTGGQFDTFQVKSNVQKGILCETVGITDGTCKVQLYAKINSPFAGCFNGLQQHATDNWKVWGIYTDPNLGTDICVYEMDDDATDATTNPVTFDVSIAAFPVNTHLFPGGISLDRKVIFWVRVSEDPTDIVTKPYFDYDHNNVNPKALLVYDRDDINAVKKCSGKGDPHFTTFDGMEMTADNEVLSDGSLVKMFGHYPKDAPATVVNVEVLKVGGTDKRMAISALQVRYGDNVFYADQVTGTVGTLFTDLTVPFGSNSYIKFYDHSFYPRIHFVRLPNSIDIKIVENHVYDQTVAEYIYMNIDIYLPSTEEFEGCTSGLCGNNDGLANEIGDVSTFVIDPSNSPCESDYADGVCFGGSGSFDIIRDPSSIVQAFERYCPCEDWDNSDSANCLDDNDLDNYCEDANSPNGRLTPVALQTHNHVCNADPSECIVTPTGTDYQGTVNTEAGGSSCVPWDSVTYAHGLTNAHFVDGTMTAAGSNCRNPWDPQNPQNPPKEPAPWCYASTTDGVKHSCDVQYCQELDCPECYTLQGDKCLYASTETALAIAPDMSWDNAKDYCDCQGGAKLTSIYDNTQQTAVETFIGTLTANPFQDGPWIGLNDKTTADEWRWDNNQNLLGGDTNWIGGGGAPSTANECVYIHVDADAHKWDDDACTENRPFICEARKCPSDFEWFQGYCFSVISSLQSQSQQKTDCGNLNGPGVLLSILTEEKLFVVKSFLKTKEYLSENFWIDLEYDSGAWEWVDLNLPLTYDNWDPSDVRTVGSDDYAFISMSDGGTFHFEVPVASHGAVCEYP